MKPITEQRDEKIRYLVEKYGKERGITINRPHPTEIKSNSGAK